MPRPYASGVVPASADAVWAHVRDFTSLATWHPAIAALELTSGSGAEVGAVRKLTLGDGGIVIERLLALDDAARCHTYEFLENPFGPRRSTRTPRMRSASPTSSRTGSSAAVSRRCGSTSPRSAEAGGGTPRLGWHTPLRLARADRECVSLGRRR